MKKFLAFLNRKKLTWKKVRINVPFITNHIDFCAVAWWLSLALWEKTGKPMYFAKYSAQGTDVSYVEIAIELDWGVGEFEEFFKTVPDHPTTILVAAVKPCEGSAQHAQAWALAAALRGKGDTEIYDTIHWFYNMLGCGYAQEVRMLCEHATFIARNLEQIGT